MKYLANQSVYAVRLVCQIDWEVIKNYSRSMFRSRIFFLSVDNKLAVSINIFEWKKLILKLFSCLHRENNYSCMNKAYIKIDLFRDGYDAL